MATATQKTELVEAAKAHFAADMLLKGTYGTGDAADDFKGCSVGCFLHNVYPEKTGFEIDSIHDKHAVVAKHFGYPVWLAHLQDVIFEGLPNGESAKWHVQLSEALSSLPDDHDWQSTLHRVHAAILRISYRSAGQAEDAVQTVLSLHERAGSGEDVSAEQWSAARSTAWSAARSAARSTAWSAARSAAWSAAESAAWSAARSAAESAAWSAAESAAWSAAESAAWSAAESAAESAARSAARSAAYQEMRDGILAALPEPIAA